MKIQRVMTSSVETCRPDDPMSTAAQIMWDADCGCVPVTESGGRLVGIITDRDICMAAHIRNVAPGALRVRDAMSSDPVRCRPTDSVTSVEQAMREKQVRRVPVVDSKDHVVGIVSLNDLARAAVVQRGVVTPSITPDEVTLTLAGVCRSRAIKSLTSSAT